VIEDYETFDDVSWPNWPNKVSGEARVELVRETAEEVHLGGGGLKEDYAAFAEEGEYDSIEEVFWAALEESHAEPVGEGKGVIFDEGFWVEAWATVEEMQLE